MYAVIVFALVLLSPMPFVSPFGNIVQDVAAQSPFGPFEPTTSPSFIIEPNAQEFGLRSEFVHSPAGTFYHDYPRSITIPVIDNHTYAVTSSTSSGTSIRNITNIASPTIVSNIPPYLPATAFKTLRIQHIVIDNSTYVIGSGNTGYFNIANISDVDNPDSLYRSSLSSVPGAFYPQTAHPVIINESPYALIGNYEGGIIIMSLASPDNPNLVHYIKDVTQNSSSEYKKLSRVSGITTITIEESVYALATNEKNGAPYGLTIINITTPSSPSLVYNGTLGIAQSFFVSTVTIDESIYAIVPIKFPQSITIINITNPYSPEVASTITKGDTGYPQMNNPTRIATTTFGTSTFALVTDANFANSGVQIIDITDPYDPSPISAITQGQDNYTHLNQAGEINIVTLDGQTYALVTGRDSDGVQIIKLGYQSLISLTSNNANPAYATEGDTLNLELGTTRSLQGSSNVKILGIPVTSPSISGENFDASITVGSEEIEKYANFTVGLLDGTTQLIVTEDDLPSNIFVDTKRPQISLIGDADLEVFPFTEESSIPGAIVTDGDPNYAGNYTITTTGNLSTTPLGSAVIFTYTAADDSVGNAGHSITRTVTVGQPNIIHFTSLNIASSSGDNFARAGQSITVSLVTDGSELGNFTGNIFGKQFTSTTNGGSASFTIEATPDDPYGTATFSITLTNASGNNITITNSLITDGSYVTVDTVSPTIRLYDPDNVTAFTDSIAYVDPGAIAYDASYGEKTVYGTGTVNTLISGTYTLEYKAPDDDADNTGPTLIRTVTVMPKPFEFVTHLNPSPGPLLTDTILNEPTFRAPSTINSAQINGSTYIISSAFNNTFHIVDITDIDSPRLVNTTVFRDNNGTIFYINYIAISTIDGNTYAISSATDAHSVLIINITNPESPSLVTYVTSDQNFTALATPTRIAITTMGEFTYALVASLNSHGVQIINITNPANPTPVIAIKDKENGGDYDTLRGAEDIAIINANGLVYALVTSRYDDGVQIIDITDISNPIPVYSIVDSGVDSSSPYTTLDNAYGIDTISIGESIYALVASFSDDGVQIINITDPENPSKVSAYVGNGLIDGAFDIFAITVGESVYALSTSQNTGVVVLFDITNPKNPQDVSRISDYSTSSTGRYPILDGAQHIITVTLNTSTYALVSAIYDDGIQVIDLTSPVASVNSNNINNPSYAKTGDSLSIELMATDIISSGSATILGLDADVSHVGENFTASVIVPSTIQEEYATYTVTLENNYGDIITLTQDDLADSDIFIDNVAPTISLDGSYQYYLVQNRSIDTIPTVTVTDGDPKYPNVGYTITTSNDLNTSKIGSTAIFTYTAKPDGAGNPGPSVTRNVTIVGYDLLEITSLTTSSNNSVNSSYAKAGDEITINLRHYGIIQNVTGNILGDDNFTVDKYSGATDLKKIITQNDINGNLTFNIFMVNSSNNAARVTQEDLTSNNIIIDTISPIITLKGTNNTVSVLNYPYADANATAYDVSYGSKNIPPVGTVDIATVGNYTLSYSAPSDFAGNEAQNITRNVIVRDLPPISFASDLGISSAGSFDIPTNVAPNHVSTFKIDTATYVGFSTLEGVFITNITDIRSSSYVSTVFNTSLTVPSSPGATYVTFVVIDGFTYALSTYFNSMLITDVTNPATPSYVAHVKDDEGGFTELLGAKSITTTTIDSSTYALVVSNFDHGVQIINITNPYEPIAASSITDGSDGYTTLAGASSITTTTIDSSTYALVASTSDNGVQIIDITNPYQPTNVSAIIDGTGNFTRLALAASITTTTIDSSTYALVASEGDDGVQIINITNPYEPIAASSVKDGSGGYTRLDGAVYVTTEIIDSRIYALVAAKNDDSIQFIDITNPYNTTKGPTASDGVDGYTKLDGVISIDTVTIDSLPYAITSSLNDKSIQIINLNHPRLVYSNNANSAYAKAGDTLTLEFAVNDTIVSSTTQFTNLDQIPSVNITNATSSATYRATLTVSSDPIEDYARFIITVENTQSVSLSITQNDFPSNVFIDTIPPRIELVGDSDHTVYVGTQNPIIPGAIATDNSPGYSASYSTSIAGTLDTSSIGSNVIYTYTAHPDVAGNLGENVTRSVTVVGYDPLNVTSLTVSSDNSINSSYAKAGDTITIQLKHDGVIQNATGIVLGDENFTLGKYFSATDLKKVITQSDTNGNLTFNIFVINSSNYAARLTQEDLTNNNIIIDTVPPIIYLYGTNNTISGLGLPYTDPGAISYDLSYGIQNVIGTGTVNTNAIGTYDITYNVIDFAGNPTTIIRTVHVNPLAPISLTNETSQFLVSPTTTVDDSADYPYLGDSYKVTTVKIDDTIYALIAAYADYGFTILDMTTPESPTLVFNVTGNAGINAALNGPTGISTIQIQNSIYAVITSLNTHSITILNITNPALPVVESITNDDDNANITTPFAVSTVDIDGTAYALVASKSSSRIIIFDITNPTSLTQVAVLQDGADYTLGGVTHVTPITMDDSTYILTAARSDNSIGIIDIGNPQMSKQVALLEDGANLALSGVNSIDTISINDRTYALVASPGDNAMQIIDVTHPTLPFPVSSVTNGTEYPVLVKPHDVTAIKVENSTYALLSAINDNSIQIIDITNPESPQPASHISQGTEYTHLEKPQTLKAVQIDGAAYALIAARNSDGIQIIKLEHEKTTQSEFSITVNGANSLYAKAGDTVSIQITVNDTIDSSKSTVQILNLNTNVGTSGSNTINASVTIPSDGIEMYTNITASITSHLGAILDLTENDIVGQNVFVDTIPPRITLNGLEDHTVLVNTAYNDQGASAVDGSPGYSNSDYSTSIDGTLDTSIIGSTVNYTYTADDDAAGNPGASINRTVTVIDYNPLPITSLTVKSDNSVNSTSYAKAGDVITINLQHYGVLENATGTILGDDNFTVGTYFGATDLKKVITQSDTNGNLTFDILVTNSSGYASSITQNNIAGSNIIIDTISPVIYLYGINNTVSHVGLPYVDAGAISYDLSYGIKDVTGTDTVNSDTIGTYTVSYGAPDFAGNPANIIRTVHVQELPELSLSSESSNLLITPESPIADPTQYPYLTDPFHIETVQIDGSTYALVASNHDGGFTILNMDNPESPSLVFNATSTQTNYSAIQGILGASPIQIQNNMYVVTISPSKILIADITNPESTTFVSERSNGTDYPYLHAMTAISTFNIGDAAYAMIASQFGSWVSILNITEPANPTHLTVLENGANYDLNTPRHIAIIDADGSTYAVITSRTTGTVTIINMDNPEMPVQIHAIKDGIDLALTSATGIEIVEINTRSYALVVSNNDHAMQIIDITHPQLPFPVSTVQSSGTEYSGLNSPHYVTALQVEDATYAFVTSPSIDSVQVIDITNPSQPNPVAVLQNGTEFMHLDFPLYIESIHTDDAAYALVGARTSNGIEIIKLGYEKTIQTPFSITSDNTNSSYAKAGDTVSIQITVNDTIDQSKSTVQILNLNANVGASGLNTIDVSVTIPSDGIEMYTNITASITSHLGAILNLTESNITGQNVFVDTIPPRITVNGNVAHTVLVDTEYDDKGASASDGSPGYSASYSTSIDGTLDPSIIGSTVNYTYTADDDAAGNPGASINRTVTVVDYNPLTITSLTVSSDNSVNSSYAKAGDEINITLVTDGSDVGNVTGDILGDDGFAQSSSSGTIIFSKTINQSDTNGNLTFDIFMTNSSGYAASITQNDLASNIIIDTISPTTTLNGNNETTIEFGSTYEDLGATVTDASYENPQIIYSSDVVDTFTIGTYTLVYTTLADPAGNPGSSIKRIVTVSDSTPVMLNSLIINTSNTNPAYAKAGDLITITLVANQTISSVDASIQNMATNNMIQGNTLYANYTVQNGQEGNTTFEITVYFDSSTPLTVTESNLNSNIYIDTEKPQLTLVGHFNITIPIDQSYTDTIANVADNDPSYNGNVSSNASRVDTSNADTYTIVYSADADAAGNIPDDITRTVTVSGFVLSIFSNNANYDTLAKKGNLVTIQLVSDQYIDSSITSATMLGRSADATSITGSTIYVNTTIQDSDINGNITFSITLNLSSNLLVTITHDDLTSANVIVDTNPPVIVSSTTITPNLVSVAFDESIITYPDTHFLIGITPLASSTSVKNGSSIPYSVLEIELNPSPPLSSNATPTITFGRAAITDLAGNGLAETSTTASDGIAPSLQDVIIVSPTIIEIIFDEKIRLGNGFTRITPSPTVNDASSSPGSTISGNALIITSTAGLFPIGVAVNITVATHGIADEAGNAFEPSSIFKDYTNAFAPYTISETMILVPYDTDLDPNTISSDDYRVSFGSGAPSTIIAAELSNDPDTVMITMQIPFGTGDTPFIEQPGTISDTLGNAVTLQSTTTRDGTAPIFISVVSASTSGLITIFGEGLSSLSFNIGNYDSIGPEVRSTDSGISDGTVIMVTSTFIDGGIRVSSPVVIEDSAGNKAKEGSLQNIVQDQ